MQESAPSTPSLPATQRSKATPKKSVRKPQTKLAAKSAKAGKKPAAPAKPSKAKKPKLVRDSFTIPKDEYAALAELKQRSTQLQHSAKKSELLRAGIKALAGMSDRSLLAALKAVPSIKTGRPKKS